ncbi:unnamed protein product [Leuciscus chuanchicus]
MIYCGLCFQQPVTETTLLLLPKLQSVPARCGSAEEIQIECERIQPVISPLYALCMRHVFSDMLAAMLVSLICVEPDHLGRSLPIDSQVPASANPQPCWVAIGNLRLAASTCPGPSQAWGVCVPVQVRESGALLGQSVRDPKVWLPVAPPKERPGKNHSPASRGKDQQGIPSATVMYTGQPRGPASVWGVSHRHTSSDPRVISMTTHFYGSHRERYWIEFR